MINSTNNKTVLILTARFGAGHISAANAIKDYLLEEDASMNVMIRDFINVSVPIMNNPMVSLYESNTKYTPSLYNFYYYLKKAFNSKYDLAHRLYTHKLTEYILDVKPDIVISTFPLASACLHNIKTKYPKINLPTVTVITDVVDSLEWVYSTTDMYFVPSIEVKNRFIQKGISANKFKVTGVPINKKFLADKPSSLSNKRKLLLLGGGRGLFDINEDFMYWIDNFLDSHSHSVEVTIVTGKNQKLYDLLTINKPVKHIKVLGFVTNMDELIKEHDLIITKPGGATLFEAIHAQTPVAVKLPKIGQEIENSKFIIDKGIGLFYYNTLDLEDIFNSLLTDEFNDIVLYLQKGISDFKSTLHIENIYQYISDLIESKKVNY